MVSYEELSLIFDMENPLTLEYFELCNKDTQQTVDFEKHHILPKSIFPEFSKCKWNIVRLSYQNHYKVHELLPFFCLSKRNRFKMVTAWNRICRLSSHPIDGETYAILRKEHCENMRVLHLGVKRTDEARLNMSIAQTGKVLPESQKKNIGDAHRGAKSWRYGKTPPKDQIQKMAEAKRLDVNILISRLIGTGIELVSGYVAMSHKAKFKCGKGHPEFSDTPTHILEGRPCPHCTRDSIAKRKDNFIQYLKDNTNLQMVSDFTNLSSYAIFRCDKGHDEFRAKPTDITRTTKPKRCLHCNAENRRLLNESTKT